MGRLPSRWGTADPRAHAHGEQVLTALVALGAGASAGALARATATDRRTRGAWWVAAAVAAGAAAAIVGSAAPVPVASAGVAAGLAAAAVVDGSEGRVPVPIAYGTTAVSVVGLVLHGRLSGDWGAVGRAAGLTALLTAGCAALWVVRVMGFGDVRLATGTSAALLGGAAALAVFVWVAALLVGSVAVVRRLVGDAPGSRAGGRRLRPPVPFAPPLAVAWLVTVLFT